MSQENVEVVRASYKAWNAGDMDAYRELYDPDAVVRPPEGWPEPGPFFGREEAMRWCAHIREAWDADTAETVSDFIDAADRVVVRWAWHGAGQGPETSMETTAVFTVRKRRIRGLEFFWDHEEALATLGLSEQERSRGILSPRDAARATSQENVEIVRQAWKAYVDHGGMDEAVLADYFAEDCVVEDFPEMPDRASYAGRDGVRERDRHFAEIWGDFVIEPVEFIDGGGDVVIVVVEIRGHGKGSGAPIDAPTAFVSELRDGKIVRDRAFTSRTQALEAVGLSEQDARADS